MVWIIQNRHTSSSTDRPENWRQTDLFEFLFYYIRMFHEYQAFFLIKILIKFSLIPDRREIRALRIRGKHRKGKRKVEKGRFLNYIIFVIKEENMRFVRGGKKSD